MGQIISCSRCGGRSRVTSVAGDSISLELLDSGAFPGKCGNCGVVICTSCILKAEDTCPKCGARGKWIPLGQLQGISTENATDGDERTEIFQRVAEGDLAAVTAALAADRSLASLRWSDGRTLLHAAVMSKSVDMVNLILSHKVAVSAVDENGQDALMYAATMDLADVVRVLLRNGANPKAYSKTGACAIVSAATHGSAETLKALIDGGADIEQAGTVTLSNASGSGYLTPTPLQIALLQGRGQMVEILLQAGANVRAREPVTGWSPLHFAVVAMSRGAGDVNTGTLQKLLERGADPHAKDAQGRTAADWARNIPLNEAVRLLEGVPKKKGWFW